MESNNSNDNFGHGVHDHDGSLKQINGRPIGDYQGCGTTHGSGSVPKDHRYRGRHLQNRSVYRETRRGDQRSPTSCPTNCDDAGGEERKDGQTEGTYIQPTIRIKKSRQGAGFMVFQEPTGGGRSHPGGTQRTTLNKWWSGSQPSKQQLRCSPAPAPCPCPPAPFPLLNLRFHAPPNLRFHARVCVASCCV